MTEHPIRFYADDAAIRRVGEGFLARTLARSAWTHEAHLATCLWLLVERPEIVVEHDLPGLIRGYNASVGGVNDDTQGYHETLTQLYIRGVRGFLARCGARGLSRRVNALLASDLARRDWPLRFYSCELLFSTAARRGWAEPDRAAISV